MRSKQLQAEAGKIKFSELDLVTSTKAIMHLYADGTSGSDLNTGLTFLSPKKTLQAVFDLVPGFVNHHVCLHLTGSFTDTAVLNRGSSVASGPVLLLDGGTAMTVVADNGGSPWVSDINSVWSLGKAGLTWTIDQYMGWWIEVVTGPAAGETRQIFSNSATTIVPIRKWSVDPGAGAQFRIVRPSTKLTGGLTLGILFGYLNIRMQNIYMEGGSSYFRCWNAAMVVTNPVEVDRTIFNITSYSPVYGNGLYTYYGWTDTTTFARMSSGPTWIGVSSIGASAGGDSFDAPVYLNLTGWISLKTTVIGGCRFILDYASRVKNLILSGMAGSTVAFQANIDTSSANFKQTVVGGGTGVGLKMLDSVARLVSCDIGGCSTHGIELINSRLHMDGVISSATINGGAGVYAHSGSVVYQKSGSTPTISGTAAGNLSTNGTSQKSTWAAIEAGTPVADTTEMVVAKKV